MKKFCYPKNPYISNSALTSLYLSCLRLNLRRTSKIIGLLLGCDISCKVPRRLFLPHPEGIIVDTNCVLTNNVVLLQQVTLGVKFPYGRVADELRDPILMEGVYVGPGAKILGPVTIGEWSIVGANAVITCDLPPFSIAVGYNKILPTKSTELEHRIMAGLV